jgi:hypothetical protein
VAPFPNQSVGRPGTPVIPADWSTAPRIVMAGTRTGQCGLRHPGAATGAFDPATGTYPGAERTAYWTGSCRIQATPIFGGRPEDAAGEAITTVAYLVAVDLDADDPADQLRVGDLVRVSALDDNGDQTLIGRDLTVQSIARGTLAWERDLVCVDQLTPPAA